MAHEASPQRCGLVQVYTGKGKGKTTAAWGLALRAVGHGHRVAVIQFLKPNPSGEEIASRQLAPMLEAYGHTRPYDAVADQSSSTELRDDSRLNFETARQIVLTGEHEVVVLDELNIVLHYGFVGRDEVLDMLSARPPHVEVVITGRYAPDWLIEAADLVTEMTEVRHPSTGGTMARKGIEY